MANISNSIRIAVEFAKKWEKLYSGSPSQKVAISSNASPNTLVYAYWDSVGQVWTIGWGNTYYADGSRVKSGDVITRAQADKLALDIMTGFEKELRKIVDYTNLTDNEYAALLSISYNAGIGNFSASRIPYALSTMSKQQVASIIQDSIVTSKGKFVQGLKNRRVDESRLFLGIYNDLYSYYLRNASTINYAVVGTVVIALTGYIYYLNKKGVFKKAA